MSCLLIRGTLRLVYTLLGVVVRCILNHIAGLVRSGFMEVEKKRVALELEMKRAFAILTTKLVTALE